MATKEGIFGEPASAASLAGLVKLANKNDFSGKRVVCIITGSGMKDPGVPARYARAPMEVPAELAAVDRVLKFST
jgi:threonine synthase